MEGCFTFQWRGESCFSDMGGFIFKQVGAPRGGIGFDGGRLFQQKFYNGGAPLYTTGTLYKRCFYRFMFFGENIKKFKYFSFQVSVRNFLNLFFLLGQACTLPTTLGHLKFVHLSTSICNMLLLVSVHQFFQISNMKLTMKGLQ